LSNYAVMLFCTKGRVNYVEREISSIESLFSKINFCLFEFESNYIGSYKARDWRKREEKG
jgi:hypothetical protein